MSKSANTQNVTRWATQGLFVLFLLVGLYCLTRAVMVFLGPESVWKMPTTPSSSVQSVKPAERSAIRQFTYDAFRDQGGDEVDTETVIGEDAPETTLNLKLVGIITDSEKPFAKLETPDRKQNRFFIDDEVISGVTLKAIASKHVVLSQNGKLSRLTFDRASVLKRSETSQATELVSADLPRVKRLSTDQRSFSTILSKVKVEQVRKSGVIDGYRLTKRDPSFDMTPFGLESGDVILRIGSYDMRTPNPNWGTILTDLHSGKNPTLTLRRDGKEMTIKVKP